MKKKKILWIILLIIGCIPFLGLLTYSIYEAIDGFCGLCIISCSCDYGISAFFDSALFYSFVYWPTYIIGIILIILSVIKLRKLKKLEK